MVVQIAFLSNLRGIAQTTLPQQAGGPRSAHATIWPVIGSTSGLLQGIR